MSDLERRRKFFLDNLLWLGWAVGYGISFPTYGFSFLIWFIFIPVLVFAYRRPIAQTVKYAFFYSIVYWLITNFWLFSFHELSLPFVVPIYSLYHAAFFFMIALFAKKLKKLRFLALPVFWIAMEQLRSIGYVGFKWNMVGDSQWENLFFIQSADLWGVWGVGFIILLCNSVLAEVIENWIDKKNLRNAIRRSAFVLILGVSVFLGNLVYGIITYNYYDSISQKSPKIKVALLQPNHKAHDPWWGKHWGYYFGTWEMCANAALQKPDIIVFAEGQVRNSMKYYLQRYSLDDEVNQFSLRFVALAFEMNTPILLAHNEYISNNKAHNSVDYIDPATIRSIKPGDVTNINQKLAEAFLRNKNIVNYSKIHLTPFGEWLPFYELIPPLRDMLDSMGAAAFLPANDFVVCDGRKGKFATLICFEDIFDILARKFVLKGVNYFLNVTNDAWAYRFSMGSEMPLWQHVAGVTTMSVSVRRPIARAVVSGVTCVIDLTGKKDVSPIGLYKPGYYVTQMSVIDENIKSVYVLFGFLFPYLICFVALGFVVWSGFFVKSEESL